VLYPATPPESSTLNHEGKNLKDVACISASSLPFNHPVFFPHYQANRQTDHEFNETIREFCNEFENPKVKNLKDIINFNEEHKEICLPERQT